MAELLLELLSEDIPPSMQEAAAENLDRLLRAALKKQGCEVEQGDMFSTPRRIGVWFIDLPHELAAQTETRRGPKISAPQQAIDGFQHSLAGINAKITEQDGYHYAQIERPAMKMKSLLAEIIPELLQNFPWPKSMRWPQGGSFRWVRPLRSVLCILDGEVVPFSVGGVAADNITYSFINHQPEKKEISDIQNYRSTFGPLIHYQIRFRKIEAEATRAVNAPKSVFTNITGILENPNPIQIEAGSFDDNQLPYAVCDAILWKENCVRTEFGTPRLSLRTFIEGVKSEKEKKIIHEGYQKLIKARIQDALFLLAQDKKTGLDELRKKLADISFHPKLGSVLDKAERFEKLCTGRTLRDLFPEKEWEEVIQPAAHYAKIDIASQTGKEFPEALGQIAVKLWEKEKPKSDPKIIHAMDQQYFPKRRDRSLPHEEGMILSLADRADTLAGFFSIGETPTGSKDPFALRRSALGIIRIILENEKDFQKLDLNDLFAEALDLYGIQDKKPVLEKLRAFITERLKFYLRAQDQSADFVAAAMRAESGLNLVRIQARLRALAQFLNTKDGDHLMTAWRRLSGILKETASGSASASDCANPPAAERFTEPAEHALAQALRLEGYDQALAAHDFPRAFALLAQLRAPVDDFFDNVRVNVDDPQLRQNRLALCAALHSIMRQAADFSSIAGKT